MLRIQEFLIIYTFQPSLSSFPLVKLIQMQEDLWELHSPIWDNMHPWVFNSNQHLSHPHLLKCHHKDWEKLLNQAQVLSHRPPLQVVLLSIRLLLDQRGLSQVYKTL